MQTLRVSGKMLAQYIGIDPGYNSGIALYTRNRNLMMYTIPKGSEALGEFVEALIDETPTYIGCEEFTINSQTHKRNHARWAMDGIAVVRYVAHPIANCAFETQGRGSAKNLATNEVLRKIGWWRQGSDEHVRDACRQLLLLLARRNKAEFQHVLKGNT